MEAIDRGDFLLLFRIVLVVRHVVMAFGNAQEGIGSIAPLVGDDEGDDARQIGLHRQHHQVEHQANVFGIIGGDAARFGQIGPELAAGGLAPGDALLDLRTQARYSSILRPSPAPS